MKKNAISSLLLVFYLFLSACRPVPASAEVATSTPTSLGTSTPTVTPLPPTAQTALPPKLQVNEMANCYSGPGENGYQLVATFESGEQLEVVGTDASNQYWIIMDPKSGKGCWVESQYTSIQGFQETLPVLIPAPTVPTRPNPPRDIDATYTCEKGGTPQNSYFYLAIYVTWVDTNNNETGFEVYKNGNLWQTLDANATQVQEGLQSAHVIMGSVTYTVLTFNETGNSTRIEKTITYHCP